MNYNEALNYIHSISWLGSKPGLSRTNELLKLLGDPHKKLKFIHIAGTNGKGSVAAMLSGILTEAGYKTGLYTSPYIERFNERMRINGLDISDDDLCRLTEMIKTYAESMTDHPTEFELITCLAMKFFCEQKCDIVVLETGLGGELDSTNVIDTPELAIITSISFDHTSVLGDTIEEIAAAKAGIIKGNGKVVCCGDNHEAQVVLNKVIEQNSALQYLPKYDKIDITEYNISGYRFTYDGMELELPLVGSYQMMNAAIVLRATEVLKENGWNISNKAIREGLKNTKWIARFEVLSTSPLFIVDGGHNPQGIDAAADTINKLLTNEKLTFIFGVMADKDHEYMLSVIAPLAKRIITVTPDNPRALSAENAAVEARKFGINAISAENIQDAVDMALEYDDSPIIALGSLYMCGDIRRSFFNRKN